MSTFNPEAASFEPTRLNSAASTFQANARGSDCPDCVTCNPESSQPTIVELTPIFESANTKLRSSARRSTASDPGPILAIEELALDFKVPTCPDDVFGPQSPVPSVGAGEDRLNDWNWNDSHELLSEVCTCQDCTNRRWGLEQAIYAENSYFHPTSDYGPDPIYQEAPSDPMFYYPDPSCQGQPAAFEPSAFGPVPINWTPDAHYTYTTIDNAPVPIYGPGGIIMEFSPFTKRCMEPIAGGEETGPCDEYYVKPDIDHNARTAAGRAILEAQATLQDYQTEIPACHPEDPRFYSDEFAACYYNEFPGYSPEEPYFGPQEPACYPDGFPEAYFPDLRQEQPASPVETSTSGSPRLKLAWQPFIKRARSLGVSDEDLEAAGHAEHM
jgi:hypothetical protein